MGKQLHAPKVILLKMGNVLGSHLDQMLANTMLPMDTASYASLIFTWIASLSVDQDLNVSGH